MTGVTCQARQPITALSSTATKGGSPALRSRGRRRRISAAPVGNPSSPSKAEIASASRGAASRTDRTGSGAGGGGGGGGGGSGSGAFASGSGGFRLPALGN